MHNANFSYDTEAGTSSNYHLYIDRESDNYHDHPTKQPRQQQTNKVNEPNSTSVPARCLGSIRSRKCSYMNLFEIFFALAVLAVSILLAVEMIEIYHINEDFVDPDSGSGPLLLHLVGDSLINHPFEWFDLPGRINFFTNYQFTIGNYGEDGQEIHQIYARITDAVTDPTPDAVILFWDSDCSNINEYGMTVQLQDQTRIWYQQNLTDTINATLSAGVKFMAVAGPELLGEGQFILKHLFWRKVDMLNDYRLMNRNISEIWNVSYINVRHEFLKDLPWYWAYSQWYETVDGEHENARGARHVGRLFGNELKQWLQVYNASLLNSNDQIIEIEEYPFDKEYQKSSSPTNLHQIIFHLHHFLNNIFTTTWISLPKTNRFESKKRN